LLIRRIGQLAHFFLAVRQYILVNNARKL
jgi:hypothetical protein